MGDRWLSPPDEERRRTSALERGQILVDLLGLSDALPAPPRRPMTARPFRELVDVERLDRPRRGSLSDGTE